VREKIESLREKIESLREKIVKKQRWKKCFSSINVCDWGRKFETIIAAAAALCRPTASSYYARLHYLLAKGVGFAT